MSIRSPTELRAPSSPARDSATRPSGVWAEKPRACPPDHPCSACTQQDSTDNPAEAAMFELVLRSSRDELRQQLQSIIGNLDATATFKDGLTALSAYMMFVLHYLENHLTTANLHNWPIISHASLRHLTSRQAFTAAVARPWGDIPGTEVADVVTFLISRFPRPPTIAIGEREIGLLAEALLSSKIPFQHMFLLGAREYAISEERVCIFGSSL